MNFDRPLIEVIRERFASKGKARPAREAGAAEAAKPRPIEDTFRRIDTGRSERAVLWCARLFGLTALVSLALNLFLSAALLKLIPLKEMRPLLLTTHPKQDAVVEVTWLNSQMDVPSVVERAWVAEYVRVRESVIPDGPVMQRRVAAGGWLYERSTTPVYQEFLRINQGFIEAAVKNGVTRQVENLVVSPIGVSTYLADYDLVDYRGGAPISRLQKRTTIKVQYEGYLEKLANIEAGDVDRVFGFTVVTYQTVDRNDG